MSIKRRSKTFLSDSHEEFGYVAWVVKPYSDILSGDEKKEYSCDLYIADCTRSISLEFDFENKQQLDKRIEKLDALIKELNDMRDTLTECKETLFNKKFYY